MDPAVLSLIGALCGGVGLKITEHFFTRGKSRFDDASRIRDELRIEITNQRTEIIKLEEERDKARAELEDLRDEVRSLQTQLTLAIHGIKQRVNQAETAMDNLPPNNK